MSVTLNLTPEIEADLLAQARTMGLSLDQFLSRQLEALTKSAAPAQWHKPLTDKTDRANGEHATAEQWEKGLEAWLNSFPQRPVLSDEALERENWYPDRW